MFDPPHLGHIAAAKYAAEHLHLDTVKLIPCKIPNHRAQTQESTEHRTNMLRLAVQAEPKLSVDTLELEREGISFMADTLAILRRNNPAAVIVLVLGIDSFNSLPAWHRYQDILGLCNLYVLARGGEPVNPETETELQHSGCKAGSEQQLMAQPQGCYFFDTGFDHAASSSLVRHDRQLDKNLGSLLDPAVMQYIEKYHLYQETSLIHERYTG
jgi:nicotinate-nucleotide adenylyltransferase